MNQESLLSILNNDSLLLSEIKKSRGFILEQLKSYDMRPSIDILMKDLSVYSIQFITDNYSLTQEQTETISYFLHPELKKEIKDEILKIELEQKVPTTEEEINVFLTSKKLLPHNIILTYEQILTYPKEIIEQNDLGENIENILKKSFNSLNVEQVIALDQSIFKEFFFLLKFNKSFFNDDNFKEFYKKSILEYRKNRNEKIYLSDLIDYRFEEKDRNFLESILLDSNPYSKNEYSFYANQIKGFKELISKDDYFTKYHSDDLTSFSLKDIEERPDFFKNVWINSKNLPKREKLHYFLRVKMSMEQFTNLIDENLILEILSKEPTSRLFGHIDNDYNPDNINKSYIMHSIIMNLAAHNKADSNGVSFIENVDLYDILSVIKYLEDSSYEPQSVNFETLQNQNKENISLFYSKILPHYLKNENLSSFISNSNSIYNEKFLKNCESFIIDNNTPNLFLSLFQAYVQKNSQFTSSYLKTYILKSQINLIEKFENALDNKDSILRDINSFKSIFDYYYEVSKNEINNSKDEKNNLYSLLNENFILFYEKNKPTDNLSLIEYSDNILSTANIEKLNPRLWSFVFNIKTGIDDEIINNKIIAPIDFIYYCLGNTSHGYTTNAKIVNFLKNYSEIHKEYIISNEQLLTSFLSNNYQTDIFPYPLHESEENNFKMMVELYQKEKNVIALKENVLNLFANTKSYELPYSREKLSAPIIDISLFNENIEVDITSLNEFEKKLRYVDLYTKEKHYSEQFTNLSKTLSFDFVEKKVVQAVANKDFKLLNALQKKSLLKKYSEHFVNYVNSSTAQTIKDDFKNKHYCELFKSQINYDKQTDIQFRDFSYKDNYEIASLMLPVFENKEETHSTHKIFYFFSKKNRDFVKPFAIEKMPSSIIYSYDFQVRQIISPTYFVTEQYTFEEILSIFRNIQKQEGFFNYTDVNAHYDSFFGSCFIENTNNKDRFNNQHSPDKFIQFLDFIKDKEPKLYAIMANYNVYSQCIDYGKTKESKTDDDFLTKDQAINLFFSKHFDTDVVLDGFKQILDDVHQKKYPIVNYDLISKAIGDFIYITTYEKYHGAGKDSTYYSYTNKEETLNIINFLFENSPTHFIERKRIGASIDFEVYFNENISNIVNLKSLQSFLFPYRHISAKYLKLDEDSYYYEKTQFIMVKIIEHCIENKNHEIIDYLKYIIKQHQFIKNEIKDFYYSPRNEEQCSSSIISFLSKNNYINQLLKKATLKINLEDKLVEIKEVKIKSKKI